MIASITGWIAGLTWVGRVIFGSAILGGAVVTSAMLTPATPSVLSDVPEPVITKIITEDEPIPFDKTTVNTADLDAGTNQISVNGKNGVLTKTYSVKYRNNIEIDKTLLKENVSLEPISEVTLVGTRVYVAPVSNCDPNYNPCVPNVSYDLDCGDIGFSVTVVGVDTNGFDRDNDGYGCESY